MGYVNALHGLYTLYQWNTGESDVAQVPAAVINLWYNDIGVVFYKNQCADGALNDLTMHNVLEFSSRFERDPKDPYSWTVYTSPSRMYAEGWYTEALYLLWQAIVDDTDTVYPEDFIDFQSRMRSYLMLDRPDIVDDWGVIDESHESV